MNLEGVKNERESTPKKRMSEVQDTGNATLKKQERNHTAENKKRSQDTICVPGIEDHQSIPE